MAWRVWADNYLTGELSTTAKYQTMKFNENTVLIGIRTWVVLVGNPTLTNLNMKIYSNEVVASVNTPKKLLHTSTNTLTKAQIITLNNGIKEIYFDFNYVPLNGEDLYNFVINGTGYTATLTSHAAWMKAFPDPIYATGYTAESQNIHLAPYQIYAIGGEL